MKNPLLSNWPITNRRRVLQIGSAGALGLSLPHLLQIKSGLAAESTEGSDGFGQAKACIVLYCWGGMSQLESWDPKPDAPKEVRGEYNAISTATSGVSIGEYLPQLARQTQRLTIVRSMRHRARDHRQASALLNDLAERGTLDRTLVVMLTEFGRQPLLNKFGGRDHSPNCYSIALGGGGIQGGRVYGKSDRFAGSVKSNPCGPPDIHATVFHALGIAPGASLMDDKDHHIQPTTRSLLTSVAGPLAMLVTS